MVGGIEPLALTLGASTAGAKAAADIWGPVGAGVALVGVIIAGVLAWWFARGPRLVMQVSGTTLVPDVSDDRVTVLYRSHPVPRVTQSLVWLWREGRGTVRGSDVVSADPITLRVPAGQRILDAALLLQTKSTNDVVVEVATDDPNVGAIIRFEYLDPRQGAAIEILHTAESPESVEVTGTVMGIPAGIIRVTESVKVKLPVGLAGAVSVTVPTRTIPRSLRIGSGTRTSRHVDLTPSGILGNAIRRLLP